jgi:hypothetical protein
MRCNTNSIKKIPSESIVWPKTYSNTCASAWRNPSSDSVETPAGIGGSFPNSGNRKLSLASTRNSTTPYTAPISKSRPTSGSRSFPASNRVHEIRVCGSLRRTNGSSDTYRTIAKKVRSAAEATAARKLMASRKFDK